MRHLGNRRSRSCSCSPARRPRSSRPLPPASGDAAARVGNRTVTMKEVERALAREQPGGARAGDAGALRRPQGGARRDHRRHADRAGGQGAGRHRRSSTPRREVAKRVKPVTDADVAGVLPAEPGPDAGARPAGDGARHPPLPRGAAARRGAAGARRRAAQGGTGRSASCSTRRASRWPSPPTTRRSARRTRR